MKTAIEFLIEQCPRIETIASSELIEQAKAMEKEQIIDAYRDGRSDQQSQRPSRFYNRNAEYYYNETFKTE